MKKRWRAILATIVFCIQLIPNFYISAEKQQEIVYNLVLFAQFSDLSETNFMAEHTEEIISYCSNSETTRSLSSYIRKISYDQMQVISEFPQLQNDLIIPYVMKEKQESYYNIESMMTEVISNVEIPQNMVLDGNSDGVIDNITVVMEADQTTSASLFWPKAFSLAGIRINRYTSGMVNLQNSYSLFENSISGGAAVLCHEFLHSVGYPDLYRYDGREGVPVGQWDIMAANSIFLQYPLAYQRYAVSGWLNAETLTKNGKYTLSPASSDNGNRLYLIKTPVSETEFFAVEFRQKGKAYSDELDVKIYGTGLVIYRVNTEIRGNHDLYGDEIYVFRPEETDLDAGKGNLYLSAYGGENAPNSVGSLNLQDTITDGALVYSDGTNSGIRISDIEIQENSASFQLDFADMTEAEYWSNIVLPEWLQNSDDIDIFYEDALYFLSSSDKGISIGKYDGINWTKLTEYSGKKVYNPQLIVHDGIPYILYNDAENFFYHVDYDSNGSWNTLLSGTQFSQYQDFEIFEDKLYLAYTEGDFPYALRLLSIDLKNKEIIQFDNGASDVCNISFAVSENEIVVSYRPVFDNTVLFADIWRNGTHETIQLSENNTGNSDTVTYQNKIICCGTNETDSLFDVNNTEFKEYSFSECLEGSCFDSKLASNHQSVYLMVNTQSLDDCSVFEWKENIFKKIGNSICKEIINTPTLIATNSDLYVSYISKNGTVMLKTYQLSAKSILGDVNDDGVFDIADVVLFQKWLYDKNILLANIQNGDMQKDGVLDGFDLCRMKRNLLETYKTES